MTDLIRITAHPSDPAILLLHVPHQANAHMGRFEPAQLDTQLGGYLIHADMLESFERFAAFTGWYTVDERRMSPAQLTRADLCDICMKPEKVCRESVANRGVLHDHEFLSTNQADLRRANSPSRRTP